MAATSYFEKVGEDADQVTYRYGTEPGDMAMSLTIDKKSLRPTSSTDRVGLTGRMALSQIIRTYEERNEWPARGCKLS